MKYKVVDNFLPKEQFRNIKELLESSNFPWFYNKSTVKDITSNTDKFQFTHRFYDKEPLSHIFPSIAPLVEKLNPSAISRIKANFTTSNTEVSKGPYHTDYDNYLGLSAVYFINTTDGPTVFKDSDIEVDCIENRILVFNSSLFHAKSWHSTPVERIVINLNFVPFTDGPFAELL